ncbi:FAD-binding oxidoreductase [Actinoallomurus soli]|uniref:FAD-binding oxidoreductase n=1 Tax=Actinoallomurus soli TaxID=2952535 RepID=UPI00209312C0|nr:FAD-binding oxidoreductase [Actinoallomurus soli]MCO5967265.1 FAD-binding oxidoreductase [Actinoallomurus soli]
MTQVTTVGPEGVARTLRDTFAGPVHLPGDAAYDTIRSGWNLLIDHRPLVVAEATGPGDVRAAVLAARDGGLPLTVQATGHGTYVPAGGLLLTTGRMAGVRVDPYRRVARVGPGARWSDVIAAAAPYGLAPLSGTPFVGVTGYTLGGGTGWLSRKYGYAADSLLRADLVTADGEHVTADAGHHADLFWALRGGGGNFGVVTALEVRLHTVGRVYAGVSLYDAGRAAGTLARYREWAAGEPDELNTAVMLMRMPDVPGVPEPVRGRPVLGVRVFHLGGYEEAERRLEPLLEAAGTPLVDGFRAMTFAEAGTAIAGPSGPPMAVRQRIDLFRDLPDAVLGALPDAAFGGPPGPAVEVRHWGGAMARPAPDAGPVGHRDVPFSVIATAPYGSGHRDPGVRARVDAGVDALARRLRPHATGGSFLNFLTDPARTATAYTPEDHARLARVKKTWDADDVFRPGHHIPPLS